MCSVRVDGTETDVDIVFAVAIITCRRNSQRLTDDKKAVIHVPMDIHAYISWSWSSSIVGRRFGFCGWVRTFGGYDTELVVYSFGGK